MVTVTPITIDATCTCIAIDVALPKTRLLAVRSATGYIMCGALDVELLNTKLADRQIIAGRAVGVRTIEELLNAPLESVTDAAQAIGMTKGMTGRDAMKRLCQHENATL